MLGYVLSLCAVGAIMLGGVLLPRWIGPGPELRRRRRMRAALRRLQQGMGQRVAARKGQVAVASGLANRADDRRRELMHERALAQRATSAAVRIVEAERARPGAEVWAAKVMNRLPETMVPKPGGAPFFDRSWAAPQTVLVRAATQDEARALVARAYPDALGFTLVAVDRAPRHLADLVDRRPGLDPVAAA